MSRNTALEPVCSKSGAGSFALPSQAKCSHAAFDAVCRTFVANQTAVPDVAGSG